MINESSEIEKLEIENISFVRYDLKVKNNKKKNDDEEEDYDTSILGTFYRIMKLSIAMFSSMIISAIRLTLVYTFTQNSNINFLQSLSTVIPLFVCCSFGVCYSTSQYFGFNAAVLASRKEYRNLGLSFNKAFLYNLIVSLFISFLFFFILGPLFSLMNFNEEVLYNNNILFKFLGFALPFQFMQFVILKFFFSVRSVGHIMIGQLIGLFGQAIFQAITILGFKEITYGTGISYLLGYFFMFSFNYAFYKFKNPCPNADINITYEETFDSFWEYVKISVPIGFICFLQIISFEILPLISIIMGPVAFSAYGVITNSITMMQMLSEAITTANNIEINTAIGKNKVSQIKLSLFVSLVIIMTYTILISFLFIFLAEPFYKLYTKETEVIKIIMDLKYLILIMIITQNVINLINEALSCLGENTIPIFNLLLFRYLFTIGLSLIFWHYTNLAHFSLILSFILGNIATILINAPLLFYKVGNFQIKNLK